MHISDITIFVVCVVRVLLINTRSNVDSCVLTRASPLVVRATTKLWLQWSLFQWHVIITGTCVAVIVSIL